MELKALLFPEVLWRCCDKSKIEVRVDQSELSARPHNFDSVSETATSALNHQSSCAPRNKIDSVLLHFIGSEDLILSEVTILGRTEHNGV
jgi:hypothetical protein